MRQAIGFIEVRSLVAAMEAADAMVKAADVHLDDFQFVGSGLVAVVVTGDVAAVTSAVEVAKDRTKHLGELISANVIPRPHEEVDRLIHSEN